MRHVFLFLLLLSSSTGSAQLLKTDTVLFIYFDKGEMFELVNPQVKLYHNNIYLKYERDSAYHTILKRKISPPDNYFINAYEFIGKTYDGYNRRNSVFISKKKLKGIRIVTLDELFDFLSKNYKERLPSEYMKNNDLVVPSLGDPQGSLSFWNQIKHIYIFEPTKRRKGALLTEVDLKAYLE
ncbi:MAG: hypothetical protein MUF39_04030 [Cyclobacteriaceae bacterium]|nr:hypothetical protein [Cyclobacteriaceae bacterium]